MDIRTERLREAFYNSGLSQKELCDRTGLTKGALSSYLAGRYYPKQQALDKLSQVLGVSIYYLMGIDFDSTSSLTREESALVEMFRELNAEGQEELIKQAHLLIKSGEYKKHSQDELAAEA